MEQETKVCLREQAKTTKRDFTYTPHQKAKEVKKVAASGGREAVQKDSGDVQCQEALEPVTKNQKQSREPIKAEFHVYHKGFTAKVMRWPVNPVDTIISYICQKPASMEVADFGCGDCKIALSVKNIVHSLDMAPISDRVTVCDMANVPLKNGTADIAVFCLSLMGTNLVDFLLEANRALVVMG
ncbi:ribosomal RNA-processing protein 8 [Esox lucius]|uniref:ribosomal RNA-processing protein 8 n=1 Tax=Esox lucius TaxID=8010 RepID=UPI0014771FE2|nr:ribosomal RNA-processing protein 8 [Esox lucius]